MPHSTTSAIKGYIVQVVFRPKARSRPPRGLVEALVIEDLGFDAYLYGNPIGDDRALITSSPGSLRILFQARGDTVWLTIARRPRHLRHRGRTGPADRLRSLSTWAREALGWCGGRAEQRTGTVS